MLYQLRSVFVRALPIFPTFCGIQAIDIHDFLDYIFNSGSAILSLSIGFNAVSTHATCTAVFATVAAVLGFAFSSIRTLGRITWLAWIGLPCILIAGMPFLTRKDKMI